MNLIQWGLNLSKWVLIANADHFIADFMIIGCKLVFDNFAFFFLSAKLVLTAYTKKVYEILYC